MRKREIRAVAVLLLVSLTFDASAEDGVKLNLGKNSPALHMPVGDQIVIATPAFEDYSEMFFDLCDAMKLRSKMNAASTP